MLKKPPRPRPLSGVEPGKGSEARVFRGPVGPVTNSNNNIMISLLVVQLIKYTFGIPVVTMLSPI